MKKTFLTLMAVGCMSFTGFSQTLQEVSELYNATVVKMNAKDYASGVADFKTCLEMCEKVGADANELKSRVLTGIYQGTNNLANELLRSKQYEEALAMFDEALALADGEVSRGAMTEEAKTKLFNKVQTQKASVYAKYSKDEFDAKNYDAAIAQADKALSFDAKNTTALLYKGRAYEKQGNLEAMESNFKLCIEATAGNEKLAPVAENVKKSARSAYVKSAQTYIQDAQKLTEEKESEKTALLNKALDMLKKVEFYGMDANGYYHLALVNNQLKKYKEALEAATAGLPLEEKLKSNFHFMIGMAHEGLGNTEEACKNYKLVTEGGYVQPAQYQRDMVLKCNN